MRYSISTCSFYKFRIRRLLEIGEPFGVEIFYEFGSEDHWRSLLTQVAQRTRGPFSIHAPFAFADVAAPEEGQLFEIMRRPFDLYHAFGGEFYVVHSYGETVRPGDETYRRDCRARAADRLARLQDICAAEGVTLAVENLCSGDRPLFDEEQFMALFRDLPDIKCVIDVGHALVAKMDVTRLQQALGGRICGYHLHDNDGKHDSHGRLGDGIMDWQSFARGCAAYTPEAVGVFEYLDCTDMAAYRADMDHLNRCLDRI